MNTFTKIDAYSILNDVAAQVMGGGELVATDTSSFVTVGETLLRTSAEKTLNAISELCVRTIFSVRPYKRKLEILQADSFPWGGSVRKLTALYKPLEESGDNNTDINPDQLANGESVDHYKINKPEVIQTNFIGVNTIEKSLTSFTQSQLNTAFQSEEDFIEFLAMVMRAYDNDLEKTHENERRLCLLNYIGAVKEQNNPERYIDLAAKFNERFGTEFTRAELLSTYFENFVKFVIAEINKVSDLMTEYAYLYHENITGFSPIPRHTPKENQRMLFYEPFFIDAKANVYSSLFNPDLLNIGEYEKVNFWQNIGEGKRTAVKVTPNYLNNTGTATTGSEQTEDYVLGVLYDYEAMGIREVFERTATTPLNAKGLYYNTFYHGQTKPWNDQTENGVVFVIGAGGAT